MRVYNGAMEKKLEQKALVGSARVLRFPDKEFALKRVVFFMRSVYPHFKKKQTKSCCAFRSHPAKDSTRIHLSYKPAVTRSFTRQSQ